MNPPTSHLRRWLPVAVLLLAAPAAAADGTPNYALTLDGEGDYVDFPGEGAFGDLQQGTIEAWVKWSSFGWNDQWFGYGLTVVAITNWRPQLAFGQFAPGGESHSIRATTNLQAGRWTHMAAVSGPGGMRLFLNGVEVARNDYTGSLSTAGPEARLLLGRNAWKWGLDVHGQLDEVRIWREERSAEQIRANLYRRLRGDEEGLVALWNFDGGCVDGPTVGDGTGNGYDGRLAGDAHCAEVDLPAHLPEPLTIRGRVRDRDGTPALSAAARLFLDGEETTILWRNQVIGGDFQFWVFDPGPYDLMATFEERGAWRAGIEAAPADAAPAIDLTLAPAVGLRGRVVHLDGTPAHGIMAEALTPDGHIEQLVESDAEGEFRFVQLPPGDYRVRLHLPDRYAYVASDGLTEDEADAPTFRVEQGHHTKIPDLELAPVRRGSFRIYGALEGLKANAILDIASTPDGRLWLATQGTGVWIFDGEVFTSLTTADGLPSDEVRDVLTTDDGDVWLATKGGLARYQEGQLTTWTGADGLPSDDVTAVQRTADGAVWIAAGARVVRMAEGRFEPVARLDSVLAGSPVSQMMTHSDGSLWLATLDNGIWTDSDGRVAHIHMRHGLGFPIVNSVLQDRDGRLWVGTENGLSRSRSTSFAVASGRFDNHFGKYRDIVHVVVGGIITGYQARDGSLWFGSGESGAVWSDGERFMRYTTADGLADDHVTAIGEDFQGGLWFGSADGRLTRYDAHSITNYGPPDGLGATSVHALLSPPEGGLWLGTDQSVWRMQHDGFTTVQHAKTPPRVTSMVLREGELWFGVPDGRAWIYRYDGANLRWFNFDHIRRLAPWQGIIHDLFLAPDGRVWAASYGGIMYLEGDAVETDFDSYGMITQGLPSIPVMAVEGDDGGLLYFGTESGLVRLDGEELTTLTTADGLVNDRVISLRRQPDGELWIGTSGGVSRYDGSTFASYTERDGLSHSRVEDIATDAKGRRWIATYGGGVAAFDGAHWSSIDSRDGLPDNRINAVHVDDDGSLWLGTEASLTRYRPDEVPPQVRIVSARSDSLYASPERHPEVIAGTRVVVDFRAVDFKTHPDKRQYRYRLAGRDQDWTTTRDGHVEWTPQEAGAYTFEVQALDRDLNASDAAKLDVVVGLPWYRNPFVVLPGGAVLLGIVALSVFSTARYTRSRREAQALREQMLEQEREARERLESANAGLTEAVEQTRQAQRRAEEANRAKSVFLANMSHELRTPLNAILGFSQLLERGGVDEAQRDNLRIIGRSGEHLQALINDVLEMARIEAGRTQIEPEDVDLHELVGSVVDMFRLRGEAAGVTLAHSVAADVPRYARVDARKLRQILINLLGNAAKFTISGRIDVVVDEHDERTRFRVADTGPGIAVADQATLFEPFAQTDVGRTQGQGAGLGLAISRQFARLMGGDLTVASEPGVGSTFRLDLPLEAIERITANAEAPRRVLRLAPGQPPTRILVVDDGPDNRTLLRRLLEVIGFEVNEACDGEQALETWASWQPQLVLMDMRMPVMDGYEATRRIRDTPEGRGTRIIALTASALEEDRERVLAAGCDEFVRKPFDETDLLERIAALLGLRYEYEETETVDPAADGARDAEHLRGLPVEVQQRVHAAASLADHDTLGELADEIERNDEVAARVLRRLVDDFAFDQISDLTA